MKDPQKNIPVDYSDLPDIYTYLIELEHLCGIHNNDELLSTCADDLYWTIWRHEDVGHFTDQFFEHLERCLPSNEQSISLLKSLYDAISTVYSYNTSLLNSISKVIVKVSK